MPSARPKLVQEGLPITGDDNSGGTADVDMVDERRNDNHNQSMSSLMNASGRRLNHSSSEHHDKPQRQSSLARAAKGTFISDKKGKNSRSTVVNTSYVVGGDSSSGFQDEKKSADSPHVATSRRGSSRNSATATSFELPGTVNELSETNDHDSAMDVDLIHSRPTVTHTSFTVQATSSSQAPSYLVGTQQSAHSHVNENCHLEDDGVERMEGVVDLSKKPPMVVLDGANIAYAYGKAIHGGSSLATSAAQRKAQPDTRGIVVACDYFTSNGIRVLAVLPVTMIDRDPLLKPLQEIGLLVPAPSRDDDDSYCITIARRENQKAQQRGDGPGYVLSNDMFRDAMRREEEEGHGTDLRQWLTDGHASSLGKTGPGRISFTFAAMGSIDDHGDSILDIIPNPRHPLIQFIEKRHHHQNQHHHP